MYQQPSYYYGYPPAVYQPQYNSCQYWSPSPQFFPAPNGQMFAPPPPPNGQQLAPAGHQQMFAPPPAPQAFAPPLNAQQFVAPPTVQAFAPPPTFVQPQVSTPPPVLQEAVQAPVVQAITPPPVVREAASPPVQQAITPPPVLQELVPPTAGQDNSFDAQLMAALFQFETENPVLGGSPQQYDQGLMLRAFSPLSPAPQLDFVLEKTNSSPGANVSEFDVEMENFMSSQPSVSDIEKDLYKETQAFEQPSSSSSGRGRAPQRFKQGRLQTGLGRGKPAFATRASNGVTKRSARHAARGKLLDSISSNAEALLDTETIDATVREQAVEERELREANARASPTPSQDPVVMELYDHAAMEQPAEGAETHNDLLYLMEPIEQPYPNVLDPANITLADAAEQLITGAMAQHAAAAFKKPKTRKSRLSGVKKRKAAPPPPQNFLLPCPVPGCPKRGSLTSLNTHMKTHFTSRTLIRHWGLTLLVRALFESGVLTLFNIGSVTGILSRLAHDHKYQ